MHCHIIARQGMCFGDPLETELVDPATVSSFDRNDLAVDAQLLANVREVPEAMDDVATNRRYILILPL